jgi:TetR/AcrR family transcriptional regulator, regulator of cefoperazone and chloramphenicol sensitivity
VGRPRSGSRTPNPTPPGGRLLERLTELARREVTQLRATGFASTTRSESSQVIDVMVRQLGHLFLQPMIDAMWRQLAEPGATDAGKPVLEVRARSSPRTTGAVT